MSYTPSFTPQYADGWEDLPVEETPITATALNAYDDAIENIENYLASDESQANIADAYDETATYAIGAYAIHNGTLYKCTTAISEAEEWDSTHWTACIVTDEMGSGGGGGTTVVANPSGTATDELEKVLIGSTIYSIPEGGGSSTVSITPTISTGTKIADFEIDGISGELYAPSGDIYSFEERQVGVWTNGKPLYQKSFHYSGTADSADFQPTIATLDATIEMKHILSGGLYRGGSLYNPTIYAPQDIYYRYVYDPSNYILSLRVGASQNSTIEADVTIQYTKTTDVAGSGEYVPSGGKAVHYSENEEVIGTFMGETLYRKSYISDTDVTLGNNSWTGVFNITTISKVITASIVRLTADNDYVAVSANALQSSGNVRYQVFNSSLVCKAGSIFTVEYTKTS